MVGGDFSFRCTDFLRQRWIGGDALTDRVDDDLGRSLFNLLADLNGPRRTDIRTRGQGKGENKRYTGCHRSNANAKIGKHKAPSPIRFVSTQPLWFNYYCALRGCLGLSFPTTRRGASNRRGACANRRGACGKRRGACRHRSGAWGHFHWGTDQRDRLIAYLPSSHFFQLASRLAASKGNSAYSQRKNRRQDETKESCAPCHFHMPLLSHVFRALAFPKALCRQARLYPSATCSRAYRAPSVHAVP